MKKILVACMAVSVVLVSCSKDEEPEPIPTDDSYQPVTVGSSWSYETEDKVASTKVSYILTASSQDSTINGKSYAVFTRSVGGNEYYYNTGDDYYQFGGLANITAPTELLYLKANVAAGSGWDETKAVNIPGLGNANLKVSYSVVEKLPTFIVEGKTYTDVIHVKLTMSDVTLSGIPVPVISQDLHFYYAAGIGKIKQQVKLNITGIAPVDNETNLKTYTIVP